MANIKEIGAKLKNNPVGAIAGAALAFYAGKKFGKVENKWALAGIAVVGAFAGAFAQSKIKAKSSTPTAETVKK